ncbi:MAG: AarF/ABC1/UbiB kinase family protein [Acidobacteriota bacterium]
MGRDKLITSAPRRFVKLGGLVGRVGASMLGERVRDIARSDIEKKAQKTEALVRNAKRIVDTLGEMRGAAMKVGQMLSLHEGILPPEVAEILRLLQKKAPSVPFEVMQYEVQGQISNYDEVFESIEPEAFASASIGQVHRARLRDGRQVAVKIQYPAIDHIITADLKNLRTIFQSLLAMVSDVDFEPIWAEVRDRLLEEIDYTQEANNLRRMAELHADIPEVVIPRVVDEASARGVLTMEFVEGIPPERACSEEFSQELRDRWGVVLLELMLRGLLEHRFLHADPNFGNFAFLEDGRIVVYDFGCVKEPPQNLAEGYAGVMRAALANRPADIPEILLRMGLSKGGQEVPTELIESYYEIFRDILRADPPYTFGEDDELYDRLFDLGKANINQASEFDFPKDIVFIDRSISGHFGNLCKLGSTGPWRDIISKYVDAAVPS